MRKRECRQGGGTSKNKMEGLQDGSETAMLHGLEMVALTKRQRLT